MSLFPPIVSSSMPAFIYTEGCRIYFSLSSYNTQADIKHVQVSVRYQTTNQNALNKTLYTNAIKITELLVDEDKATEDRFYIELNPSDLEDRIFHTGINYKVQLRFSEVAAPSTNPSAGWFSSNLTNFSEWSTVCLIRGIEDPTWGIMDLQEDSDEASVAVTLSSSNTSFWGYYGTSEENEALKYWRMRLYQGQGESLVSDSGQVTVNSYDFNKTFSFEFRLPYILITGYSYKLVLDIETRNGYLGTKTFSFMAMSYSEDRLDAILSLEMNEEEGYAKVTLAPRDATKAMNTNVTLRRTSSRSNFTIWEDIANKTFENETLNWEFDDFTVESGVFYQYGAQPRDNLGRRGVLIRTGQEIIEFEDAFLTEHGESLAAAKQLKLKYDLNISNMKTNVMKTKTDTIGSQYPYIRRNGRVYYKSFPLTGTITWYMDESANLFTTEHDMYNGTEQMYDNYHNEGTPESVFGVTQSTGCRVFNPHYDYIKEREFRKAVEDFLYNDNVKIFRSETEGNILVELMDVSLTPNQTLHRMIYTFSATAYEIAEATIDNFDYFGIQKVGTYSPNIEFDEIRIGNMQGESTVLLPEEQSNIFTAGRNIMDIIKSNYHYGEIIKHIKITDLKLSYLRIEVESPHYLIVDNGTTLVPLDDIKDDGEYEIPDENTILGTIITIDGQQIVIAPPNNVYEMKDDNVSITSSIIPAKDTKLNIDFVVELANTVDTSDIASTLYYSQRNGQLFDNFASGLNLITQINYKYQKSRTAYYFRVAAINTVNVEANPGTVFYARSTMDDNIHRYVIGETGELFLDPGDDAVLDRLYMYGVNFVDDNELTNRHGNHIHWVTTKDKPYEGFAYKDGDKVEIFHNGQWVAAVKQENGSYDIPFNVDAIINYFIEVVRGEY